MTLRSPRMSCHYWPLLPTAPGPARPAGPGCTSVHCTCVHIDQISSYLFRHRVAAAASGTRHAIMCTLESGNRQSLTAAVILCPHHIVSWTVIYPTLSLMTISKESSPRIQQSSGKVRWLFSTFYGVTVNLPVYNVQSVSTVSGVHRIIMSPVIVSAFFPPVQWAVLACRA